MDSATSCPRDALSAPGLHPRTLANLRNRKTESSVETIAVYGCKREQIKLIWTNCHKNTALNESKIYLGTY